MIASSYGAAISMIYIIWYINGEIPSKYIRTNGYKTYVGTTFGAGLRFAIDGSIPAIPNHDIRPLDNPTPGTSSRQKANLFDDQLDKNSTSGSVAWYAISDKVIANSSSISLQADIEIVSGKISGQLTIAKQSYDLSKSKYLISLIFKLDRSIHGNISSIPGIVMRETELLDGIPLIGSAKKKQINSFEIALSANYNDTSRNMQLLRTRPWLVIPLMYDDGHRAIITLNKGFSGEQAFARAINDWEQREPHGR